MSRYFTAPKRAQVKAEWWDGGPLLPHLTVGDHEATDTGLLDAMGNAIWRAPETMGFIRDDTFATQAGLTTRGERV